MPTLPDFTARAITGAEVPLARYADQVVLVVNTASQCGFTPQYQGLEKLYATYASQGLVVLGFPCDQFGQQEPGDEASIADFCELNFGVTFPLFAKVEVNGHAAHPLFRWLRQGPDGTAGDDIEWNFTKFLVGRDGVVLGRYASAVTPEEIADDIEAALSAAS